MMLENILTKEELEKIKKIGKIVAEFKLDIYKNQELNLEAKRILMRLVDEDICELIRDIIGDAFVEYIDEKTKTGEDKKQ